MPDSSSPIDWRLTVLPELDSTNDEALRRLSAGADAGEIIIAERQSAGKGRAGREWQSLPGNLAMTATVEIPDERPASDLAFVTAVAVMEAVNRLLPGQRRVEVKWPNDLLLEGSKLGGILIETDGALRVAAVGIGLNLVRTPKVDGVKAVCLAQSGGSATPRQMAELIGESLSGWWQRWREQGLLPVIAAWRAAAVGIGEPILVRLADGAELSGRFADIADDGRLTLQMADGEVQSISAGDVFFG